MGPSRVPGARRRPDVRRLRAAVRALDLVALGDDAPADEYDDVADRALSVLARTGDPGAAVGAVRRYLARVWGVGLDDTGADRLHALLRDVAGTPARQSYAPVLSPRPARVVSGLTNVQQAVLRRAGLVENDKGKY